MRRAAPSPPVARDSRCVDLKIQLLDDSRARWVLRIGVTSAPSANASGTITYDVSVGLAPRTGTLTSAGIIPTPAVAYLTPRMGYTAGVVISASHNPFEDNGIKVFARDGYKLPDEVEAEIEALMMSSDLDAQCAAPADVGYNRKLEDARGRYVVYCKATFPHDMTLDGLRIVVDVVVVVLHGLVVLVGVDEQLLQRHVDVVLDRLQAPRALTLQVGVRRPGDEHPLHDRLDAQVELDLCTFGDTEELDAEICRRRNGQRDLPLGPRAAAELASVEHERRSRVQVGSHVISIRAEQIGRSLPARGTRQQNASARSQAPERLRSSRRAISTSSRTAATARVNSGRK